MKILWDEQFKLCGKCKPPPSPSVSHGARALPKSRCDPTPALSHGFWGPSVPAGPLTLLQLPTRQAEQGLREHLRAGTGLSAAAQPLSLPLLQRTGLHTAPTPHVAEHCNTGILLLSIPPPLTPQLWVWPRREPADPAERSLGTQLLPLPWALGGCWVNWDCGMMCREDLSLLSNPTSIRQLSAQGRRRNMLFHSPFQLFLLWVGLILPLLA